MSTQNTSIGELSVGVTLDTKQLDAGFREMTRKMKAQAKQLDKEYGAMAGGRAFGFGGGYGSGYGGGSRRGRGSGGAGLGERSLGERLGGKIGGDVLGRYVGGGRIADMVMNGMGSTGGGALAAAAGGVSFLSLAVRSANASKSLDSTTLAVQRFGEAVSFLKAPIDSIKKAAGDMAVEFVGTANRLGEFIGSGFNWNDSHTFDSAARGAAQQDAAKQRLAKAQGFDSWSDYAEAVKGQRGANAQFARDQSFAGTDDQGRARMLSAEIESLRKEQETAKVERRTLDVEKLKGEIASKTAELEAIGKQIEQRQREFDNFTRMSAAGRMDADDAANAERQKTAMEGAVKSLLSELNLDGARKIAEMRLGANALGVSAGASGFGGTAADGATAAGLMREQGRTLVRILEALQDMAEQQAFGRNN